MKRLLFLFQYIGKPRTVGSILPSSRFLGDKMMEEIDFKKAKYIIEYGPGTGVFTKKLLEKRNPETIILLVEQNKEFYSLLKEKFKDERNLFIVYGSAENIIEHVREYGIPYIDYVISGLPFASLPKSVSTKILLESSKILKKDGEFITFQYTMYKKTFIKQFFTKIDVKRELRNVPPAYVFSCSMSQNSREESYGV
ncbi:methyltransferase [Bacillus atrophaeus]|uniref:class I SAM-dependent methyltransferase n=1 Tax=Bacillus atrophaeus TaxID=1452 RepID=UPI0022801C05|nr:rRNA adenine N-6-methyltransferase family protein [Bacillus atrophaeus]MCY8913245.1 methyltransferase [Bacillus atrophaeus]MCY9113797.1 methyltransferase [Bacillus atrophaeus]MEC0926032.1 rRNA adenine N-6-methyltransferase family protein [Bacillus atrophaeus]MEC0933816.1 rRNA adenine N-6-methyltransferase family protein [Bacillus atrophaeus]